MIIARLLYHRGVDQIIRQCVLEEEHKAVIQEAHLGAARGHFSRGIVAQNVIKKSLILSVLEFDSL